MITSYIFFPKKEENHIVDVVLCLPSKPQEVYSFMMTRYRKRLVSTTVKCHAFREMSREMSCVLLISFFLSKANYNCFSLSSLWLSGGWRVLFNVLSQCFFVLKKHWHVESGVKYKHIISERKRVTPSTIFHEWKGGIGRSVDNMKRIGRLLVWACLLLMKLKT